jgi:hypothetical protein
MNEITIQRAWLETLTRYEKRTREALEKMSLDDMDRRLLLELRLYDLLGYISSAETILNQQ